MLKLNRRIAAIKPSATLAADARATEMKLAGIDVISLAAGEPDFDTPEHIKRAADKALAAGQTKYTPVGGTAALKNAIKLKLKRDNNLDYEPGEIIASAGCKQAEANVIAALFDEGDEVIIPTPAWVSFAAMVSLSGAEPKFVPCSEESGFMLEPEALRRAITPRTRGIMLNSPSNPTGAVYGPEQLTAIARVLVDTDIWVMSDDVYEHIVYDGLAPHMFPYRAAPQVPRHRVQLAVENLRDDRMAHRICGRTEGSDRGCRPLAEPEQRQSQFDHAGRRHRGADRSAGRAQADARGVSRAQRAGGRARAANPGLQAAQRSAGRVLRVPERLGACSAAALATSKSPTATRSRRFCSTRRTSRWSAATTSARPITSGSPTPLRRRI